MNPQFYLTNAKVLVSLIDPLTDPNIYAFWRSDTGLYTMGGGNDSLRNEGQSSPKGWADQTATLARWTVQSGQSAGPLVIANDCNGKPSVSCETSHTDLCTNDKPTGVTNQPISLFLLVQLVSSPANSYIWDGYAGGQNFCALTYPTAASNLLRMNANAGSGWPQTTDLAFGTWGIVSAIFDGASSILQINNGTEHTGDPGSRFAYTFVMGADGGGSNKGKFKIAAGIVALAHSSTTWRTNHKNWLAAYAGLTI